MKITSLTQEQIDKMAEYRDRWTAIGLSTEPADRPRAEAGILAAYRAGGINKTPKIIWCQSPLSQGLTRAIVLKTNWASVGARVGASVGARVWDSVWDSVSASVRASVRASVGASVGDSVSASVWASVGDSVRASVGDSVRASVWASVGASVWASVGASVGASVLDSVRASVGASVWASVGASVWDSVWASVGASVRDSVGDSVLDSVGASVGDSVKDSGYGQHDAGWLSFYSYFREVCCLDGETDKLQGLFEIAQSAGWWLPHDGMCWVSERPTSLHRDANGRLHNKDGMAIRYPDGWGVYALHGVRVPGYVVETPAADLDPKLILQETNAEVRREIVRKVGIERVCTDLGAKVVDRQGDMYELLSLDLGDGRRRPYLKMRNPSIGVFHIEGVHPDCDTVEKALKYRNGTSAKPAVLT